MQRSLARAVTAVLAVGLVALSAAGAAAQPAGTVASPAAKARADGGHPPYTAADVRFLSGMIGHHAQAVLMAGWAPTHGASKGLQILAERIAVAQQDEIAFMQRWLADRKEPVPSADASHDMMPGMEGMGHAMMPGMLTAAQLTQLDQARGPEFDRLFLTFMIQHHRGALSMVDQLFGSPGAGQDDQIFKFASDVSADQETEIARMTTMLEERGAKPAPNDE